MRPFGAFISQSRLSMTQDSYRHQCQGRQLKWESMLQRTLEPQCPAIDDCGLLTCRKVTAVLQFESENKMFVIFQPPESCGRGSLHWERSRSDTTSKSRCCRKQTSKLRRQARLQKPLARVEGAQQCWQRPKLALHWSERRRGRMRTGR